MKRSLLALPLLAACNPMYTMYPPATEVQTVTIEWRRVTPSQCGGLKSGPLYLLLGCATSYQGRCVIEMPADAPDWLIAHELKHCFGYTH